MLNKKILLPLLALAGALFVIYSIAQASEEEQPASDAPHLEQGKNPCHPEHPDTPKKPKNPCHPEHPEHPDTPKKPKNPCHPKKPDHYTTEGSHQEDDELDN